MGEPEESGVPRTARDRDPLADAAWGCRRLRERLDVDRVAIWVYNDVTGTLSPATFDGDPLRDAEGPGLRWARTPIESIPLLAQVIREQRTQVIEDVTSSTDLPGALVADFAIRRSIRLTPLFADRPVGILTVEPAGDELPADVLDLVQLVALSVGQSTALRREEYERRQAELLLELSEAGVSSQSLTQTLGEICQRLAKHARMNRACLHMVRDGVARPRMARYADGHEDRAAWEHFRATSDSIKITDEVLRTGQAQVAETAESPLIAGWWSETFDLGSALAVPVGTSPNISGVLVLDDPAPRTFSPELVRLMSAAGGHVDAMIRRATADDERTWSLRTLASLRGLLQRGSQSTSVSETGALLANVAKEALAGDHALFVRQRHGLIVEVSGVGLDDDRSVEVQRLLVGQRLDRFALWQSSLERGEPALIDSAETVGLPPEVSEQFGDRSCAVLPVSSQVDDIGIVHVGSSNRGWASYHSTLAEQLSLEAKLVVDNTLLRERENERLTELAHASTHDALTGLPNRTLLGDRLSQALKQTRHDGHQVGLLFVDLDRFKRINDRIGHVLADELLREVATRLRSQVREEDTVSRFAGDEFVVLLRAVDGEQDATRVADRIREALAVPVKVGETEVFVSASVGIACAGADSSDGKGLLRAADAAMYRAKRNGRGGHAVYDPAYDVAGGASLDLEADLHYALERDQFSLRYQPIVELLDGHARGFEALLRWEHPDRGTVAPLDFIPLAEATGTILPIGAWVIDQACAQLGIWRRAHPDQDLFVSVNLSAIQLHDPKLVERTELALALSQVPPHALLLEITESTLMHEEALPTLERLSELGVRLAIDDFGTGYSALGYLQRLPIDVLKVDRSFVSSLGSPERAGALAGTVLAIAQSIGLSAIAEGIEQPEQLSALRDLGSQMGQGYHFARPLRTDEATSWLDRPTSPPEASSPQPDPPQAEPQVS